MDDKALLKLLEADIAEEDAAKQLRLPGKEVRQRLKIYLEKGILRCNSEKAAVDWKAYGRWKKESPAE